MSKIVNLRTTRKQMARAQKRRDSAAAAATHCQSSAERALEAARAAKVRANLDAHKREP
ncbi:MAG: DUF4169 family protein [Roseinatronobacter sp.]